MKNVIYHHLKEDYVIYGIVYKIFTLVKINLKSVNYRFLPPENENGISLASNSGQTEKRGSKSFCIINREKSVTIEWINKEDGVIMYTLLKKFGGEK